MADRDSSPFVEVLYGSAARGDGDRYSDLDLLIVDDGNDRLPSYTWASVVRYTWAEFSEMSGYGSLFLRHLRSEGRILNSDSRGQRLLNEFLMGLRPYSRVAFDLHSFELAIADGESALALGDTSTEFELASLATVMRHCAILGCYLMGCENFTRYGAFDLCCDRFGLESGSKEKFRQLYGYRIALARGLPFECSSSVPDGRLAVASARLLLNGVREYATYSAVS
ncbi:nucleotidyltransferase domain-containing protein [Mycobacterium sp. Y57]|uniref:nucleotidyltransferase domain-containing protein n=1 Tax=Mycolicibacterium xanthum TaxID=2796469 RepID=UPI001C85DF03|nr:nucleotidyltransferase domain-containing protein [Mycolicibacterium xanthum]